VLCHDVLILELICNSANGLMGVATPRLDAVLIEGSSNGLWSKRNPQFCIAQMQTGSAGFRAAIQSNPERR
jgi:hypothetical protein